MYKAVFAAVGAMVLASSAAAETIVNTGPGLFVADPLNPTGAVGAVVGPQLRTHGEFFVAKAFRVTGIEWYGTVLNGGNATFTIAQDGGDVPGLFTFFAQQGFTTSNTPGWYGISGLEWDLLAGQSYWLGLGSDGGTFLAQHYGGSANPLGNEVIYTPTGFYTNYDNGDFAWRVTGEFTSTAVPEASTWAMMIIGFALAGTVLRRRRVGLAATA